MTVFRDLKLGDQDRLSSEKDRADRAKFEISKAKAVYPRILAAEMPVSTQIHGRCTAEWFISLRTFRRPHGEERYIGTLGS